jgi:hypothetical protein
MQISYSPKVNCERRLYKLMAHAHAWEAYVLFSKMPIKKHRKACNFMISTCIGEKMYNFQHLTHVLHGLGWEPSQREITWEL